MPASIQNKTILLVDDSPTILNILKKNLNQFGVENLSLVKDGEEAWDLLNQKVEGNPFDLVLCDWNMPKISGIELLEKIRASSLSRIKNIKFIMITGAPEKVKEAMNRGADNILSKPFTADEMKAKIEFILR